MGHVSIKVAGEGTKLIIKMKDTLPERYIKLFYVESFNCGALQFLIYEGTQLSQNYGVFLVEANLWN